DPRRRCATPAAEGHDCLRDFVRIAADYVVAGKSDRSGCYETHCNANDWRRNHFGIARTLNISRDLRDVEGEESAEICLISELKQVPLGSTRGLAHDCTSRSDVIKTSSAPTAMAEKLRQSRQEDFGCSEAEG